jgi:hypothetical protein
LESAKKVQKIKEGREKMLKYQMLPKVLRKIALKKISQNLKNLKKGSITFKHDKKVERQ